MSRSDRALRHLVLVGMNYNLCRGTGDKNFWLELIPLLAKELKQITVLSIKKDVRVSENKVFEGCNICVRNLSPTFLESPDAEYKRPRLFWRNGAFPTYFGVLEKFLSGRKILPELDNLNRVNPFEQIHLMDNLGYINRFIAEKEFAPVSVSAMAYQGKKRSLYDRYLRLSYDHKNLTVVTYSDAYAARLRQIGIKRLVRIRWGTRIHKRITAAEKRELKRSLLIPQWDPLFLWSGYIQQIKRKDFIFALCQARKALKQGLKATFFFAFKPESFDRRFVKFHQPSRGIYVAPTDAEQFYILKVASDVFFSPVTNSNCILAPPLTWIETMAHGIPILTTNISGAEEIIESGHTGFITTDDDDLCKGIFQIKEKFRLMKRACIRKVKESYNIENSAKQYLRLWRNREMG